jgi:hypothetical protein
MAATVAKLDSLELFAGCGPDRLGAFFVDRHGQVARPAPVRPFPPMHPADDRAHVTHPVLLRGVERVPVTSR